MNPQDFSSILAGQVLQVGSGQSAYHAFIPNSLPPVLAFEHSLVRVLSNADRSLGELAGLGRTITNPHLLIQPFIRREAVLSSRIEGTQADIADLYAYEAGQLPLLGLTAATEPDVREVLNYVRALEHGLNKLDKLPVSLRLIREIHAELMSGVRGGYATLGLFRTSQNWIGGSSPSDARFVPPPVPQMLESLDLFEKYLHSDDGNPPLIRLGFIHYHFECIHPFVDGNGRIGRLLIPLLMMHWNLLPSPLLYLSAFFERNRQRYYELLLKVSQEGDWQSWLHFFLSGIADQAQDAVHRAKHLQDLQANWRDVLMGGKASLLCLQIMEYLFEHPIVNTTHIKERFQVSLPTVLRALRQLESLGMLKEMTGLRRNQLYVATEIIQVLDLS